MSSYTEFKFDVAKEENFLPAGECYILYILGTSIDTHRLTPQQCHGWTRINFVRKQIKE